MRQLRLVGLSEDGASLLLESPTGDSYRLPVDERVRAACRGDLTRLGQIEIEMDNPLRPREIQSRVRAGESAEQIAASSGMPLDRVLRFAYAVLQERGRVVAQARATAARPKATDTLGDLVEDRLVSHGTDAGTLQWDAWRRDDGRWSVKLSWRHGDREHAAHWSLDLARRLLVPEDPAAEQLTAAEYHARTITAVTPMAVAARAADPSRIPDRSRPADPGRTPERSRPADAGRTPEPSRLADQGRTLERGLAADSGRTPERGRTADPRRASDRPADPGRASDRPADPGRAPESGRPAEQNRVPDPAREPVRADGPDREPRRVVERRPGEPSRRAHRGEAVPAEAAAPADPPHQIGPNFEEIRAGGRRPGSDHRADLATQSPGPQGLAAPRPAPQTPQTPARRTDPAAQQRDAQTVSERRADPTAQLRDAQTGSGRRADPAAQLRDAQTASGRRADPAGQMRDARSRPGRPDNPREQRAGQSPARGKDDAEDPPADEVRQIAAGGGTIPLVESEEDRARRATVPSWDDILLGVRRHH